VNPSSGLTVGDFFPTMQRDLPVTVSLPRRRVLQVSVTQDRISRIGGRQNGDWQYVELFVEGHEGLLCVINFPKGAVLVAGEKPC
jgi:hypothetical protein